MESRYMLPKVLKNNLLPYIWKKQQVQATPTKAKEHHVVQQRQNGNRKKLCQ